MNKTPSLMEVVHDKKNFHREIIAGVTGYFAIMYVIFVNPQIVAVTGMPVKLVTFATIFAGAIGCLLAGFWAKSPMIIVPGMGINALFSYTIKNEMGFTWETTLTIALISSIIFTAISFSSIIDKIADSITQSLKSAITAGIGAFLAFVALTKINLVVSSTSGSVVKFGNILSTPALLAILGIVLTLIFQIRGYSWGMVGSMVIITVIALLLHVQSTTGAAIPISELTKYPHILAHFGFVIPSWIKFITAIFAMLMLMIFEGVGICKGLLPDQSQVKPTLQATGLSNIAAAILGSSPTVDAAEAGAAITAGGRTGITSITTGILFLASIILTPIIGYIPSCATTSIIILTACSMMGNIKMINMDDFTDWFPAFLIIIMIPFTGNISVGMAFGFIMYPIAKLVAGKREEINPINIIIALLFAASLSVTALI
ncbi:NCS2 family permease [Latilactobacillus curvatus]|uniref:NCS2 family permease n=1 Tax=Latilactobacillus curvatus TaxID=28038 RepID=UPI0024BB746A|nr:NCS2 family permease [Latilactobacillus curvatus]WHQ77983.1 NCS2 family permease [Latilactobacillus curvatus]